MGVFSRPNIQHDIQKQYDVCRTEQEKGVCSRTNNQNDVKSHMTYVERNGCIFHPNKQKDIKTVATYHQYSAWPHNIYTYIFI
jgi:hypothetical protein